MTVLLHGEGPTDFGLSDGVGGWKEGPVQVLLRRLLGDVNFVCVPKENIKEFRNPKSKAQRRKLQGLTGHGASALIIKIIAYDKKCDVVFLYRDCDRETGGDARKEHDCRKRYLAIKNDIMDGFMRSELELKHIAILPMKMIENWLLSELDAFRRAFGFESQASQDKESPNVPASPELIWGAKEDPASNYPKHYLSRVLSKFEQVPCTETFIKLMEEIDLELIREKCTISFADFYLQLEEQGLHGAIEHR